MPFINLNKVTDIAEEAEKLNFTELLELRDTINRMVNNRRNHHTHSLKDSLI
jgi:hypothetical protein